MLIHELMSVAELVGATVLYLLLGLSVISIAITIERAVYFAQRRVDAAELGRHIAKLLRGGDQASALRLLSKARSVEAAVMHEAISRATDGNESVHEIIEATLRDKKKEYERGLLFLGTLGNNAPFVGLFGTVLGIVNAFKELGSAGASGQMGNVMGGIAEALVATAVGILVAIPAVVAFNTFQKRAGDIEDNVATLANHLFAELKRERRPALVTGNGAVATSSETPSPTSAQV